MIDIESDISSKSWSALSMTKSCTCKQTNSYDISENRRDINLALHSILKKPEHKSVFVEILMERSNQLCLKYKQSKMITVSFE